MITPISWNDLIEDLSYMQRSLMGGGFDRRNKRPTYNLKDVAGSRDEGFECNCLIHQKRIHNDSIEPGQARDLQPSVKDTSEASVSLKSHG